MSQLGNHRSDRLGTSPIAVYAGTFHNFQLDQDAIGSIMFEEHEAGILVIESWIEQYHSTKNELLCGEVTSYTAKKMLFLSFDENQIRGLFI